jgi:hypothetical protein
VAGETPSENAVRPEVILEVVGPIASGGLAVFGEHAARVKRRVATQLVFTNLRESGPTRLPKRALRVVI